MFMIPMWQSPAARSSSKGARGMQMAKLLLPSGISSLRICARRWIMKTAGELAGRAVERNEGLRCEKSLLIKIN